MTDSGVVRRAARATVSALSMVILAGALGGGAGCGKVHNEFDPREFQRIEHDNVNTADVPPKRALPPDVLEPPHCHADLRCSWSRHWRYLMDNGGP